MRGVVETIGVEPVAEQGAGVPRPGDRIDREVEDGSVLHRDSPGLPRLKHCRYYVLDNPPVGEHNYNVAVGVIADDRLNDTSPAVAALLKRLGALDAGKLDSLVKTRFEEVPAL